MRLSDLFRTPRPRHAFAVTEGVLLYGFLDGRRTRLERLEERALPADTVQLGPVGLLQVKAERLRGALDQLRDLLGGLPKRAGLVVPDAWVRALVLEVESLPRLRQEAEEVLRWRLKKLLPCRPEEVRLDYTPCGGNGRVLVVLGLDKPLSALEESFSVMGCQLGSIEPVSMALAAVLPPSPRPLVLVSTVGRGMAMVVMSQGQVLLSRLKLMPHAANRAQALALRELGRTSQFLTERGLAATGFSVVLAEVEEPLAKALQLWALEQKSVDVRRLGEPPGPPVAAGERLWAWGLVAAAQPGEGE
ncbi:MAG: hypothetical protein N2447_08195 [Thermoanaerobaculum sp.]|nr:hypothetical protein [Thermoanaerobaculum sp.]